MAFQLDQLSIHGLRRLVKDLRASLSQEGVDLPQHRVQEVLARTLGHANWHDAQQKAQKVGTVTPQVIAQPAPSPVSLVEQAILLRAEQLTLLMREPQRGAALMMALDSFMTHLTETAGGLDDPTQRSTWPQALLFRVMPLWARAAQQAPSGRIGEVLNMMFPVFYPAAGLNTPHDREDWLSRMLHHDELGIGDFLNGEDTLRLYRILMEWCVAPLFSQEGGSARQHELVNRLKQSWTQASPSLVPLLQQEAYRAWMPHLKKETFAGNVQKALMLLPLLPFSATKELVTTWMQQDTEHNMRARYLMVCLCLGIGAVSKDITPHEQRMREHRRLHFLSEASFTPLVEIAGTERVAEAGELVQRCLAERKTADQQLATDPELPSDLRSALLEERALTRPLEWIPVMEAAVQNGTDSMILHLTEWLTQPQDATFWWKRASAGESAGHRTFQDALQRLYPAELSIPPVPLTGRRRRP